MSTRYSVCWTNNCRGKIYDQLYIMHAHRSGSKTLCGCRIQEIGEYVSEEYPVDCERCIRIMEKQKDHSPTIAPPVRHGAGHQHQN